MWFNSEPITLVDGKTRLETPPLQPGKRYRYTVKARWGDVEREWILRFAPGDRLRVVLDRDDPAFEPPQPNGGKAALQPNNMLMSPELAAVSVLEEDGVHNFGIDRSRINGRHERFMLNGREISRAEAIEAIGGAGLVDDSNKLRLTIIGTEAERACVLADLNGPLKDMAADYLVQAYSPNDWAVAKAGFVTTGKPTIYIQQADGVVLHRQDDYADGAAGLRTVFERLRKPDPNYQPAKDNDLRRGGVRLLDILARPFRVVLSWLLTIGVIFLLVVLIIKGWPLYFLSLCVQLIPSPPSRPGIFSFLQSAKTVVTKTKRQSSKGKKK